MLAVQGIDIYLTARLLASEDVRPDPLDPRTLGLVGGYVVAILHAFWCLAVIESKAVKRALSEQPAG
jgi:hypothetical protein